MSSSVGRQTLAGAQPIWLGLKAARGGWLWADGTEVKYVNWYTTQPDKCCGEDVSCATTNWIFDNGKWFDTSCQALSGVVCKYNPKSRRTPLPAEMIEYKTTIRADSGLAEYNPIWIGLNRIKNRWFWNDLTDMKHKNWQQFQPDMCCGSHVNCAELRWIHNKAKWFDTCYFDVNSPASTPVPIWCRCPRNWVVYNEHCYQIYKSSAGPLTTPIAAAKCRRLGAELAEACTDTEFSLFEKMVEPFETQNPLFGMMVDKLFGGCSVSPAHGKTVCCHINWLYGTPAFGALYSTTCPTSNQDVYLCHTMSTSIEAPVFCSKTASWLGNKFYQVDTRLDSSHHIAPQK
ncbi:unnamed protein product [Enterobius vermicularis]|uniref:C-type lectin domain-containing protein n=1 Tax=Enterobius vermicularis TaxID=51028 RepID=A0A0N4VJV4_ENTVE|nr:unnamed protein product [Enterobius vermicularis]